MNSVSHGRTVAQASGKRREYPEARDLGPKGVAQNVAIEVRALVDTAQAELDRAFAESQKDVAAAVAIIEQRHRARLEAIRATTRARAAEIFRTARAA